MNANSCLIGQNKRRKDPNGPSWVEKKTLFRFPEVELRHMAFGRVTIKLQFEPKAREY